MNSFPRKRKPLPNCAESGMKSGNAGGKAKKKRLNAQIACRGTRLAPYPPAQKNGLGGALLAGGCA